MTCGPSSVTGLILCGGASSRMGQDKAHLLVGGRRLLEAAVERVRPLVDDLLLACGAEPRYQELGLPVVLDREAGGGPLLGLEAGLEQAQAGWLLAVACDLPALDHGTLQGLLEAAKGSPCDIVVYSDSKGDEPLCALYHTRTLPFVRAGCGSTRQ